MGTNKDGKPSHLQRLTEQAIGHDLTFGLASDPAAKDFPQLWDWLTNATPAVGRLVVPASITIRAGPEGFLATLNHKDYATSLDVACPALADVFKALEAELTKSNPAFRRHTGKEPKTRKRKIE